MKNRRRHGSSIDVVGALALLLACAWAACADEKATSADSTAEETGEQGDSAVRDRPEPRTDARAGAGSDAGRPSVDATVSSVDRQSDSGSRSGSMQAVDASTSAVDGSRPAVDASTADLGPYACEAKLAANPPDPGGNGAEGSACCGGLGSCKLRGSIALDLKQSLGHDTCEAGSGDDDLRCAPMALAHAGVCHAQTGAAALEGRCLPRCFLAGTPQALLLTTTDCGADDSQVCGACFDPVTGRATGVCTLQEGDRPNEPAPAPFKECGVDKDTGGAAGGVCMPTALAMASGNPVVADLPRDVCADSEVCVPKLKANDFNACFARCETSLLVQAAGSKEGGCIPPYIAAASNPEAVAFLEQGTCAAQELCAPCLDPTKDFVTSGACE